MSASSSLIAQVRRNCDISDAHHGGIFSVCGLALRLRDLFKWERGLAPWEEGDPAAVLDWIGAREAYWETLAGAELAAIELNRRRLDPFDAEAVNAILGSQGLFYGAGYARGLKPTFFLAAIESEEEIAGCRVYGLGRELARDLQTLPALSQGASVILRRESAAGFLWDQITYMAPSGQRALDAALEACGIRGRRPSELRRQWDGLLQVQEMIHLRHELGEIQERDFRRDLFQEIMAAFPLTRSELLARHVKDLLADTHPIGPLAHICRTRSAAGLALYSALADRLTRSLFPELTPAADAFRQTGDWAAVERAVDAGRAAARGYAGVIISTFCDAKAAGDLSRAEADIERCLGGYLRGDPESPAAVLDRP
jgi:hypothetical protein